jgi:hypothetical protein
VGEGESVKQFTNGEIRAAIYRAAAHIESHPDKYDFWRCYLPASDDCGCMLFHVGRELGLKDHPNVNAQQVVGEIIIGDRKFHPWSTNYGAHFYFWLDANGFAGYQSAPTVAASALRAYADKYFPADEAEKPALDSAFLKFRDSFVRSMESA